MIAKDRKNTRYWAIAPGVSAGAIVGYTNFFLVNRETGREHTLHIPNGGLQVGVSASGGPPSYTLFQTSRPVNFNDFDGAGARITSANIGLFYGYSMVYLTLWTGSRYNDNQLAYVKMSGGSFMMPGGAVSHGVAAVSYGSGRRSGTVPMILVMKLKDPPITRMTRVESKAKESPRVILPDDVMFDFGKHTIKSGARRTLLTLADMLNNRAKESVVIEGYTDAIGEERDNKALSLKRANAVKQWLIHHKVYKAAQFKTVGYGEAYPLAPNTKPNGADNPTGRSQNRRVEVKFKGALPKL